MTEPQKSSGLDTQPTDVRSIKTFIPAMIWLGVTVGVLVAQLKLRTVFREFGIELPVATQYVLHISSLVVIAFVTIVVFVAGLAMPKTAARRLFLRVAAVAGIVVGIVFLVAVLVPLFSVLQGLSGPAIKPVLDFKCAEFVVNLAGGW